MERLSIAYSRKFIHSLDSQLNILFRQGILNRIDRAEELVMEVYDFVENNVDRNIDTPVRLISLGRKYLRYMIDDEIVWLLFLDQEGDEVVMTHLLNNQSPEYTGL